MRPVYTVHQLQRYVVKLQINLGLQSSFGTNNLLYYEIYKQLIGAISLVTSQSRHSHSV